jgi:cell division protein FtsB
VNHRSHPEVLAESTDAVKSPVRADRNVAPGAVSGHEVKAQRLSIIEKSLGAMTALLVLLTTLLGVVAKKSSDERGHLADTVSRERSTNEALTRQNADLRNENASLSHEIDQLKASAGSAVGASRPADATSPTPVSIFRKSDGPVVVRKDQSIDLDSTAPDWSVTNSTDGTLSFPGYLRELISFGANRISLVTTEPRYDKCADRSLQYLDNLTPEQTKAGALLCVKTFGGRLAGVRIVDVGPAASFVSLDITVWG